MTALTWNSLKNQLENLKMKKKRSPYHQPLVECSGFGVEHSAMGLGNSGLCSSARATGSGLEWFSKGNWLIESPSPLCWALCWKPRRFVCLDKKKAKQTNKQENRKKYTTISPYTCLGLFTTVCFSYRILSFLIKNRILAHIIYNLIIFDLLLLISFLLQLFYYLDPNPSCLS